MIERNQVSTLLRLCLSLRTDLGSIQQLRFLSYLLPLDSILQKQNVLPLRS